MSIEKSNTPQVAQNRIVYIGGGSYIELEPSPAPPANAGYESSTETLSRRGEYYLAMHNIGASIVAEVAKLNAQQRTTQAAPPTLPRKTQY